MCRNKDGLIFQRLLDSHLKKDITPDLGGSCLIFRYNIPPLDINNKI